MHDRPNKVAGQIGDGIVFWGKEIGHVRKVEVDLPFSVNVDRSGIARVEALFSVNVDILLTSTGTAVVVFFVHSDFPFDATVLTDV